MPTFLFEGAVLRSSNAKRTRETSDRVTTFMR